VIVGAYTLHLYCDNTKATSHRHREFPHEFVAEFGSRARANARRAGWRINKRDGEAICPKCRAKERK